jgi:hypothetical protein
MLFIGNIDATLNQMADSTAGAMSLLIGVGANISITEKRTVYIKELLK